MSSTQHFILVQIVLLAVVSAQPAIAQNEPREVYPGKSWAHASAQVTAQWSKEKLGAASAPQKPSSLTQRVSSCAAA